MSETKRWVVTTSGDRSLKDVEKNLRENGFEVDQTLETIGLITGAASDAAVKRSRSIDGVTDVSPEEPIDIGPPDAPITW